MSCTHESYGTEINAPTDKQIVGTYYKTAIQPIQYIHANNLNFFEGNVIKYITRHRSKGGKADLEKAIHYIEMLMEFEYPELEELIDKSIIDGVFPKSYTHKIAANKDNEIVSSEFVEVTENSEDYKNDPSSYETKKYEGCIGCIFYNKGACTTNSQKLADYCSDNLIIYTSLKK